MKMLICNIMNNKISEINFEKKIRRDLYIKETNSGPCKVIKYKELLLVLNYFSGIISFVEIESFKEIKNIYIGRGINNIKIVKGLALVVASECRFVSVIDLEKKEIMINISIFNMPSDICVLPDNKFIVSDLLDNSLYIMSIEGMKVIEKVCNVKNPSKIEIDNKNRKIIVLENTIDLEETSKIKTYELDNYKIIDNIKMDIIATSFIHIENKIYIISINGILSVYNINSNMFEYKRKIGNMFNYIMEYKEKFYICDSEKYLIYVINKEDYSIKRIKELIEPSSVYVYE